jgi:hypothetical protein
MARQGGDRLVTAGMARLGVAGLGLERHGRHYVYFFTTFTGVEAMAKSKTTTKAKATKTPMVIAPPNFKIAEFKICGNAAYVQNKFSEKARVKIADAQKAGQAGRKGTKKDPKDFMAAYEGAKHVSSDGWCGIPAAAFRNALISACKMCGFAMTRAKMSVFIIADGLDDSDGTPLVKITKGKPEYSETPVRNDSGVCDLRPRPMWKPGWEAKVVTQFDADQFTLQDVSNLLVRAGIQVGVGEGRPDSKKSNGVGWGTFDVVG